MDHFDQKSIHEASIVLPNANNTLSALETVCKVPEITYASFVFLKYLGSKQTYPFVRTTYPAAWVSYYLQNSYLDIDPTIAHARKVEEPFFWNEVELTESSITLMNHAGSFGILPIGFVLTVRDKQNNHSFVSLNTGIEEREWVDFINTNIESIKLMAKDIHLIAVSELEKTSPVRFMKLTKREIEVLQWTAEGKSYFEIGIILELSENTIHGYAKSARLKLDSVSISQAVSRATKLGLI